MATTVTISMKEAVISREETAPNFIVNDGDNKFGTLIVSKGGVRWLRKGNRKDAHFSNWSDLDKWMQGRKRR